MVRKDGDTMKECMKTNNPTEFRSESVDLANAPDVTAESNIHVTFKEENGVVWHKAKIVNTTYNVNLRAGTDIDSSVIGYIHPDSEFMISAVRTPDWYKVRLKDGTEGYASSKYVAKVMPNEHT